MRPPVRCWSPSSGVSLMHPPSCISGAHRPQQTTQPELTRSCMHTGQDEHSGGDPNVRRFACPFYRLDPMAHDDCLRFTLNRVQDVMQHLRRKHKTDLTFDFSTNAKERRHLTAEKRWLFIWKELFPEKQRPSSVHLGNHLEEAVSLLEHYWKQCSSEILEDVLEISSSRGGLTGSGCGDRSQLHDVIVDMVKTVVSRMALTGTEDHGFLSPWTSSESIDEMLLEPQSAA